MNNFRVVFVFKSITTPENIPKLPPGNCKIGTELKIVRYGPGFFSFFFSFRKLSGKICHSLIYHS